MTVQPATTAMLMRGAASANGGPFDARQQPFLTRGIH